MDYICGEIKRQKKMTNLTDSTDNLNGRGGIIGIPGLLPGLTQKKKRLVTTTHYEGMEVVPKKKGRVDPYLVFVSKAVRVNQEAGLPNFGCSLYENNDTGAKTLLFVNPDVSIISGYVAKHVVTMTALPLAGGMYCSDDRHWYSDTFIPQLEIIICTDGMSGESALSEGMSLVESDYRDYPELIHLIF